MTYGTETAMIQGLTWGCLDNGDMILDRDSGEFVPADQVIHDPLHIDQLDFLNEDGFGYLKAELVYEQGLIEIDDVDEVFHHLFNEDHQDFDETSNQSAPSDFDDEPFIGQGGRIISVRKQSISRHKRGKIALLS